MKKPEFQWVTPLHRARREPQRKPRFEADARSECFRLHFSQREGFAELSLSRQLVDAASAEDPELRHAVAAWLIARGQRSIDLQTEGGEILAKGRIAAQDFDRGEAVPPWSSDPSSGAPALRLATLAPSNFELMQALGLAPCIVACEDSSPLEAAHPDGRSLGPDLAPDIAALAAISPQMVLASLTVPGMERVVMQLRQSSLAFRVFAPRSLDDVVQDIQRAATAVGCSFRGEVAARDFQDQREELLRKTAALRRPVRVFLQWWPRPIFSPGKDCYSNELIELAGGRNVFGERDASSFEVSPEELSEVDPELAFVSWCGVAEAKLDPARLWSLPEVAGLEFAQQRRVFPLDEAYSGRPGPEVLEAARRMWIHIEAYAKQKGLLALAPTE